MKDFWKFVTLFLLVGAVTFIRCDDDDSEVDDEEDEAVKSSPKEKVMFIPPKVSDKTHYAMFFTAPSDLAAHMVVSQAKKDGVDAALAKYDGIWSVEVPTTSAIEGDFSLVLKSKAKHHAVSSKLRRPFTFESKQLVVQYEVKFEDGMDCGGAYIKLLTHSPDLDLKLFNDKTPYTIMFGPDKCGMDHKLHFIFRHKHPKTGEFEEKHAKKPKGDMDKYFTDKKSHLYTLVLNDDNTFEIYIDQVLINSGSLLEDMTPAVNPEKEIDDPNEKKPADWDERAKIPDPTATKPMDWDESEPEYVRDSAATKPAGWLDDEPTMIPDPNAVKPKDWDDDMDGEWEAAKIDNPKCTDAPGCGEWQAPTIKNPVFKGKWSAPLIDNPNYRGLWTPKKIANPNYFEDSQPYKMTPFSAIGLELWSMSANIVFDNFFISDNKKDADDFVAQTWDVKREAETKAAGASGMLGGLKEMTNEMPWLWAVIILVIVLPIVLVIVYCCTRSSGGDDAGRRKKTDEAEEDDEEEEEEEEEGEAGAAGDDAGATERRGKGSLEEDPEEETAQNDLGGNSSEEDKSASTGKPSSRKRKTRKE